MRNIIFLIFLMASCVTDSKEKGEKSRKQDRKVNVQILLNEETCYNRYFKERFQFISRDSLECLIKTVQTKNPKLKNKTYSEQKIFFLNVLNNGVVDKERFHLLENLLTGQMFLNREFIAYTEGAFLKFIKGGIESKRKNILLRYYKILLIYGTSSSTSISYLEKYFSSIEQKIETKEKNEKRKIKSYLEGKLTIMDISFNFSKEDLLLIEKEMETISLANDFMLKRMYILLSLGCRKFKNYARKLNLDKQKIAYKRLQGVHPQKPTD